MLRFRHKNFVLISKYPIKDIEYLLERLLPALSTDELGRGKVSFLSFQEKKLALKKYTHGGLLRAITSDMYLSEKRLLNEVKIIEYLSGSGVICPKFFLGVVEKTGIFKRLFLVTERLDGYRPLIEVLEESKGLNRLKYLYRLARLTSKLASLRVYHPDFHLRNVLSGPRGVLALIDFDGAEIKGPGSRGIRKMVLRLFRYIEKIGQKKRGFLKEGEKLFLLKAIKRLADLEARENLNINLRARRIWYKISWFLESLIHGGKS